MIADDAVWCNIWLLISYSFSRCILSYKTPFVYPKDERQNVERAKITLLNDKLDGPGEANDIDRQSDHLLMMTAYKRWVKILNEKGAKAAQQFCNSYFLSSSVMYTIR